jgi:hypothetical protein
MGTSTTMVGWLAHPKGIAFPALFFGWVTQVGWLTPVGWGTHVGWGPMLVGGTMVMFDYTTHRLATAEAAGSSSSSSSGGNEK